MKASALSSGGGREGGKVGGRAGCLSKIAHFVKTAFVEFAFGMDNEAVVSATLLAVQKN
jgi:hypothetical protein